jgi:hypothetical protein
MSPAYAYSLELYIQHSIWLYKNILICEVSCVSRNEHFCLSELMDLCVFMYNASTAALLKFKLFLLEISKWKETHAP